MTATARLPRTIRNHYRIPHPAIINFSGGRTSAYMLKKIVDAYGGGLPGGIHVIFALSRSRHNANYIRLLVMSGNRRVRL